MQNEFEKNVRDRLQEFSITPADTVWTNVEGRLTKEKKQRKLVYFWWAAAILLVGATGVWLLAPQTGADESAAPAVVAKRAEKNVNEEEKKSPSASDVNNGELNDRESNINEVDLSSKDKVVLSNKPSEKAGNTTNEKSAGISELLRKNHNKRLLENAIANNRKTSEQKYRKAITSQLERKQDAEKISRQKGVFNFKNVERRLPSTADLIIVDKQTGNSIASKAADSIAENKPILLEHINNAVDSASLVKSTASPTLKKYIAESRKLKFGFTVYAGISDNKTGFPIISEKTLADNFSNLPQNSSGGSTGGSRADDVSALKFRTSFSFGVGAFLDKPVSKRLSISAGIDYHVFSSKTFAGAKVSSQRTLFDSSLNVGVVVNEFYSGALLNSSFGQPYNFTNRYHLLNVPIHVNLKINKSSSKAIRLSAGLTPGVVTGTRALYYNRFDRISYVDKKQFRTFQLFADGGLQLTVMEKANYNISIGPQARYGLRNLSKPINNAQQHLFFAGLKSNIVFK